MAVAVACDKPYDGVAGAVITTTTGSAFASTDPPYQITAPGFIGFTSPLDAANFAGGAQDSQIRCVGAAIYVRSVINPLVRKGVLRAWRAPIGGNANTITAAELSSMAETRTFANDGREIVATYKPRSVVDLGFRTEDSTMETYHFGIFGEGLDATDSFEVEYIAFYETISKDVANGVTASHSDPAGIGAAFECNVKAGSDNPHAETEGMLHGMVKSLRDTASYVLNSAAQSPAAWRMASTLATAGLSRGGGPRLEYR